MPSRDDFFNLYRHGFVRVAVATPRVRIGDPRHNADATLELMQQAARDKALLAVFPELGLSAYTCDDLFHQRTLIDAAESALAQLLARTRNLPLAALVGLPVAVDGRLYNCAALLCRGRLVGVVPKTYLPNYREFYEARQFTPGDSSPRTAIALAGQDAAFGTNLLFRLAAARARRRRSRPAARRPHAAEHLCRRRAPPPGRGGPVPQRGVLAAAAQGAPAARAPHRPLPLRAGRCGEPRSALRGGVPHP